MEAQRSSECLLPLFASGSSAFEKWLLCKESSCGDLDNQEEHKYQTLFLVPSL